MIVLDFEQKVVRAALYVEGGDSIKDILDEEEIEDAIKRLADVYVTLGLVDVADLDSYE